MKNKTALCLLALGFGLLTAACGINKDNKNYQLKGKLSHSSGEYVSLVNINSARVATLDSAKTDDKGEFIFTKKVPEKGFYNLQISSTNYVTLVADSTEKITVEGDAKDLNGTCTIHGSEDSKIFSEFNTFTKKKFKEMESVRTRQDSIRRVFEAYMNTTKDSVSLDSLSKTLEPTFNSYSNAYQKLVDETTSYLKKFIDAHTASFASLAAVQMLSPDRDIPYFIKVSDALTAKYPAIETLKEFKVYVDKKKQVAQGMAASEITMNDQNGTPLSLSSLKGKVVILDFWASWCKPCRAESPFVVSLYTKYKDKGLDIFSVSLDQKKESWLAAIKSDKLSWKNHVCDFKMWQSPVVTQYGFTGIPFTCVLDREGKIAGTNLRGPALEDKIKELLNIKQ